ncbi:MAG TPA: LuxR C-terminal-related transcriptional regulator [Cellulomonas sp.]
MGKTTLLEQLSDELAARGEAHDLVRCARDMDDLRAVVESIGLVPSPRPGTAEDLRTQPLTADEVAVLVERIEQKARRSPSARYRLIVDDFDWCVARCQQESFRRLLEQAPSLLLVTASLEPQDDLGPEEDLSGSRWISAADLSFSRDEVEALCDEIVSEPAARFLTPARRDLLFRTTAGHPLAVMLALDRVLSPGSDPHGGLSMAPALLASRVEMQRQYPPQRLRGGFLTLLWQLSFLPRFTLEHVARLHPNPPRRLIRQVTEESALDRSKAVMSQEFVWGDQAWRALSSWNVADRAERHELAGMLERAGDAAGAFEQWLFARDLRLAERVLRRRFFTVFEGLTPEGAQELRALPEQELRGHPVLRVVATLLDPYADDASRRRCAESLHLLTQKKPDAPESLLAGAVRAVLALRNSRRRRARQLAGEVLETIRLRQASEWRNDDRTLAEARLVAVLVLLAAGSMPDSRVVCARNYGDALLDRRSASVQSLLEAMRGHPAEQREELLSPQPLGYRALAFPESRVQEEIAAWEVVDRRNTIDPAAPELAGAEAPAPRFEAFCAHGRWAVVPPPAPLQDATLCIALLVAGNTDAAVTLARQSAPLAPLVRAMVELVRSNPAGALDEVEAWRGDGGDRLTSALTIVRAAAYVRLGREEAAGLALTSIAKMPDPLLVGGATLVSPEDLAALSRIATWFDPVARTARLVGVLGTGLLIRSEEGIVPLTRREQDILGGIALGLNTKEIAEEHFLSVNTVKTHTRSLSRKLRASGRADIINKATGLGLLGRGAPGCSAVIPPTGEMPGPPGSI